MKNKSLLRILLLILVLGALISPIFFATRTACADENGNFTVPKPPQGVNVSKSTTMLGTINPIITWVSSIVGIVCVAYIVFAGIKITTAGENEEKRKEGIKTMTYSIIGLVIVLLAYAIVAIVASGLEKI